MPLLSLTVPGFLFGSPLAALGAAAAAVSVPLIIHLLNRKRFRIVRWAAMRFLLAAQRQNVRRMRLEQLVLLAVRTVLVLVLVLAMASVMPWAEEIWQRAFPASAAGAIAGSQRTHRIVVLDGSFSMATRSGGEATYFDRARALAVDLLHTSPSGDGFSVILMGAPPQRIVPEPSDDAARVAREIQALRLPHGNADVPATLNAIDDMLRRSPSKFDAREVYFLTDLQRSTWTTSRTSDLAEVLQRIQGRARAIFVDVGQEGIANLAVTNLALGVPLATTGASTPIIATIHNFGGEEHKQARVELLVGRARNKTSDPPFALRAVQQQLVTVPPGRNGIAVSFEHKFGTPGEYVLQVRLVRLDSDMLADSDALDLDDVRGVVVAVKDDVPVMLVNGKPAAELYDRATEWLHDALNPYQTGLVPRNIPARPRVVSETQFADAARGDLTPFDCVFLCDVARIGAREVQRLETHLRRGGGVVFCLGPRVDREAYNRLVYRQGKGILPAHLLGVQTAPENWAFTLYGDGDSYKRPPLDAFASDIDRASLQFARIRQYVQVEQPLPSRARKVLFFMPAALMAGGPTADTDKPKIPVGDPAIIEWQPLIAPPADDGTPRTPVPCRGRVVLITSTVNMDWTSWPISPSYPPLMQELMRFAVAGRLREQVAFVNDTLEEFLQASSAGLDVKVHTPDGRTVDVRTLGQEDAALLRFTETDQSGVYRALIGQHPHEYLFAVNVPTATEGQQGSESDLAHASRGDLQEAYPGWEVQVVTALSDVDHSGGAPPGSGEAIGSGWGTVLARYLLLAFLVLLLAEVVLAWMFGHYSTTAVAPGASVQPGRLGPVTVAGIAGLAFVVLAGVLLHTARNDDFLGFLPDRWRGGIEGLMGVAAPTPGEGTRWKLEYSAYLTHNPGIDPWLIGAIAVLALALVGVIYVCEGKTAGRSDKFLLGGLRAFVVLIALAVLLPQLRLWFERQGWPDLAILIDDSRSMSAVDRYRDLRVHEAADRLVQVAGLSEPQRLQLAQALLTRQDGGWLASLLERRKIKVHIYHCASRAARLADVSEPADHARAVEQIQQLRPEGESTQLGTAVRQVLNDFRGSSLSAIIVLSDGVTTEGEDLVSVSRYSAQMGVPLYCVGIGDAHEIRDLILHDLRVDDTVYANDTLVFEASLTGQGYSSLTTRVTLYEKTKDGKKELDRQSVTVDPQGKAVKVRLRHRPTEPGEKVYILEVPVQRDEAQPADNNRLERTVLVRDARPVQVLYIEGYTRWEFHNIKRLLERENSDDPRKKTVDLKVVLLDARDEFAAQDRSARADIPPRAELNQFDVIILGDVDPRHPKVGEKNLKNLADFVRERGGGLLMIAGERFAPRDYKDTPLKDVLPIVVAGPEPDADRDWTEPYRPVLTPVGRLHPIFRFSADEAENNGIWERLPELYWWSRGYRTQPAAEVLAVHPRFKALDARPGSPNGERQPLIVQQFVGAGRCMFFGIEETWRWAFREDVLRFDQFWLQTVRYLARNRQGRTDLRLDRQVPYRRGEPIRITVRFPDDSPPPAAGTEVKVVVKRKPSPLAPDRREGPMETEIQTLQLAKVEGSRATYEALLTRTPEGDYRFELSTPTVPGSKPRAECRVLPPPGEMERLRMNQPDMERAAEESQGRFYSLADADRLLDELPAGTRVSLNTARPPWLLWNNAAVFGLVMFLLSSEWILRKRKHLL